MKKLSLLVALALLITVSGVYATWSYSGTNDIGDAYAEAKVQMAGFELTGANGTYKVESNLVLTVDQANNDHEAKLVFGSNNSDPIYLTVTFTPAANAPQTIKENAVSSELYFGVTTPMQYKMDVNGNYDAGGTAKDIFEFANPSGDNFSPNVTWTKQPDGSFTYTLDETALKAQISLSQTFVLDIKAEYDEFRKVLVGNIVARITDGVVTP